MTLLDAQIHWTDKTLERVHPRRHDASASAPQADSALWTRLGETYARYLPALERGMAAVDENRAALMRRVIELLPARAAGGLHAPLDVDVEAAMGVSLGVTRRMLAYYSREEQEGARQRVDALVADWVRVGGLDFAVQAAVASAHWELVRPPATFVAEYFDTLVLQLQRPAPHESRCDAATFLALRRAVSTADDAAYAKGREAALHIRQGHIAEFGNDYAPRIPRDAQREQLMFAALWERCMLSYAFADEPWWEEDLTAAESVPNWMWLDVIPPLTASVRGHRAIAFMERAVQTASGSMLTGLATFVYNVGPAADRPLIQLLDRGGSKDARQIVADTLSLIETPDVADKMASLLVDKDCRAIASQYFVRVPRLAAAALLGQQAAGGRGELAEAAGILLARLARTAPDALLAAPLDEAQRAAVEALCAPLVEAAQDELPSVLSAPPWIKTKGRARRSPVVMTEVKPPQVEEKMTWRPMEREALLKSALRDTFRQSYRQAGRPLDADQFDPQSPSNNLFALYLLEDEAAARRILESFPPSAWTVPGHYENQLSLFAATFELAFLPVLALWGEQRLADVAHALTHYASPRVAPLLARALHEFKTVRRDHTTYFDRKTQPVRPLVHGWLVANPAQAAAGLIPAAVGPLGPARDAGEAALRFLAANGHSGAVHEAAAGCGATAAVDEILGYDPLLAFPDKLPKKGSFWKAAELPRPLLAASGHALPLSAMENLGTMLSFSPPYAGLDAVRAACDPKSLDAFVWSLFQTWLMDGAPAKETWPLYALASLGSDDMARRLAPLIKAWPREGAQARAVLGLDVLAQIGSDVALRVLFSIAERGRKALKDKARQRLDELARLRGLSAEDLADRLVEDFDLDESGTSTLDYGARQFIVGFDDEMKPYVVGPGGEKLKDLPAPSGDDDAELAAAAADQWKQLKKDARKVFTEQAHRLEMGLVSERRWPVAEFRDNLLGHPLLLHLVRRLVWGVFDEDDRLTATFRVANDLTLEDEDERPFTLPAEGRIGLVHPLALPAEQAAAWTRLLAAYGVVPPFPQLGRPQKRVEDADAMALAHLEGRTTTVARLLGLERRGWRKGTQVRNKHALTMSVIDYEKPVQNGAVLSTLRFAPGFDLGSNQGTMTLGKVEFRAVVAGRYGDAGLIPLGRVSPVAYSEIMGDLDSLKASK